MKYLSILNSILDGVLAVKRDGTIVFCNDTAYNMLGYTDNALEGKFVETLMPEAFRDAHVSLRTDFMDHPQQRLMNQDKRFIILRKDGSEFPASISLNPTQIDGEALICVAIQDMSEQEAEAIKREQSQKLEALGEMVGGIAHNFNNVIAGITGQVYLLGKHEPLSVKGMQRLESVQSLCDQAAGIIHQLMVYARHQSDGQRDFTLAEVMHEVMTIAQITATEKISIDFNIEQNESRMHGSGNQIQQTMLNLINNAIQAIGDAEGSITVSAKTCTGSNCHFKPCSANRQNAASMLCVQVCDTGGGISQHHLHRIFDPFFTTKAQGQGTGLGLSTSYGIIKKHGGDIAVRSKTGEGSTFQFYLPILAGIAPAEKEIATVAPIMAKQASTLLIIDDDPSICNILSDVLTGFGYATLSAGDGQQGVDLFTQHQHTIALVLSDIAMPKLDGYEVLAGIRAIAPLMPFLFITGYEDCLMTRFDDCDKTKVILKPFDFVRLSHDIHDMIAAS